MPGYGGGGIVRHLCRVVDERLYRCREPRACNHNNGNSFVNRHKDPTHCSNDYVPWVVVRSPTFIFHLSNLCIQRLNLFIYWQIFPECLLLLLPSTSTCIVTKPIGIILHSNTIQYNIKTYKAPYVTKKLFVAAGVTRD